LDKGEGGGERKGVFFIPIYFITGPRGGKGKEEKGRAMHSVVGVFSDAKPFRGPGKEGGREHTRLLDLDADNAHEQGGLRGRGEGKGRKMEKKREGRRGVPGVFGHVIQISYDRGKEKRERGGRRGKKEKNTVMKNECG